MSSKQGRGKGILGRGNSLSWGGDGDVEVGEENRIV